LEKKSKEKQQKSENEKERTKTIYLSIEFTILLCQVFTNLPAELV
jgi:hypothetical protein